MTTNQRAEMSDYWELPTGILTNDPDEVTEFWMQDYPHAAEPPGMVGFDGIEMTAAEAGQIAELPGAAPIAGALLLGGLAGWGIERALNPAFRQPKRPSWAAQPDAHLPYYDHYIESTIRPYQPGQVGITGDSVDVTFQDPDAPNKPGFPEYPGKPGKPGKPSKKRKIDGLPYEGRQFGWGITGASQTNAPRTRC